MLDVHIEERYKGPLDLLLYLIRRDEIDIQDIPIAHITKEFLKEIRKLESIDVDNASDFVSMAAMLMEIKARMLLPPDEATLEGEDDIDLDPRKGLVEALLEYKRFKEAANDLQTLMDRHQLRHPHIALAAPAPPPPPPGESAIDADIDALFESFASLLYKALQRQNAGEIVQNEIATDVCIEAIATSVQGGKRSLFTDILGENPSRQKIVVFFIAMLEMIRLRKIRVYQSGDFGEIYIEENKSAADARLQQTVARRPVVVQPFLPLGFSVSRANGKKAAPWHKNALFVCGLAGGLGRGAAAAMGALDAAMREANSFSLFRLMPQAYKPKRKNIASTTAQASKGAGELEQAGKTSLAAPIFGDEIAKCAPRRIASSLYIARTVAAFLSLPQVKISGAQAQSKPTQFLPIGKGTCAAVKSAPMRKAAFLAAPAIPVVRYVAPAIIEKITHAEAQPAASAQVLKIRHQEMLPLFSLKATAKTKFKAEKREGFLSIQMPMQKQKALPKKAGVFLAVPLISHIRYVAPAAEARQVAALKLEHKVGKYSKQKPMTPLFALNSKTQNKVAAKKHGAFLSIKTVITKPSKQLAKSSSGFLSAVPVYVHAKTAKAKQPAACELKDSACEAPVCYASDKLAAKTITVAKAAIAAKAVVAFMPLGQNSSSKRLAKQESTHGLFSNKSGSFKPAKAASGLHIVKAFP